MLQIPDKITPTNNNKRVSTETEEDLESEDNGGTNILLYIRDLAN